MPSKKSQLTFKTKLQNRPSEKDSKKPTPVKKVGLLKDTKYYPKSYRWCVTDIEMIEQLVNRINEVSYRELDTAKSFGEPYWLPHRQKPKNYYPQFPRLKKSLYLKNNIYFI